MPCMVTLYQSILRHTLWHLHDQFPEEREIFQTAWIENVTAQEVLPFEVEMF